VIGRQPDSPRKPELSWTCTVKTVENNSKLLCLHKAAFKISV